MHQQADDGSEEASPAGEGPVIIPIKSGKVIVTPHEIVVRLDGPSMVTMQARADVVELIGRGANVVAVNSSEARWTVKLDDETQLQQISDELGCEIR